MPHLRSPKHYKKSSGDNAEATGFFRTAKDKSQASRPALQTETKETSRPRRLTSPNTGTEDLFLTLANDDHQASPGSKGAAPTQRRKVSSVPNTRFSSVGCGILDLRNSAQ